MWKEYGKWENMKAYGKNMNQKRREYQPKMERIWTEKGEKIEQKIVGFRRLNMIFFHFSVFSIFSLFEGQIDFTERIITRTLAREHKEITGLLWERIIFMRENYFYSQQ